MNMQRAMMAFMILVSVSASVMGMEQEWSDADQKQYDDDLRFGIYRRNTEKFLLQSNDNESKIREQGLCIWRGVLDSNMTIARKIHRMTLPSILARQDMQIHHSPAVTFYEDYGEAVDEVLEELHRDKIDMQVIVEKADNYFNVSSI